MRRSEACNVKRDSRSDETFVAEHPIGLVRGTLHSRNLEAPKALGAQTAAANASAHTSHLVALGTVFILSVQTLR